MSTNSAPLAVTVIKNGVVDRSCRSVILSPLFSDNGVCHEIADPLILLG